MNKKSFGDRCMDYLDFDYNEEVYHELINKKFGRNITIPHELYFLKVLIAEILADNTLAEAFVMYIVQYYPEYNFSYFNHYDYLATALVELDAKYFQFEKKYIFQFKNIDEKSLNQAMMLGDIATDFLIRYRGFSLIKSSGQNIIITSRSDCHKRFEELLSKGYSLQRRAKVGYVEADFETLLLYPCVTGHFYKLPVLPTRDIGYPIDEIIEDNVGKYRKVLQLKK